MLDKAKTKTKYILYCIYKNILKKNKKKKIKKIIKMK